MGTNLTGKSSIIALCGQCKRAFQAGPSVGCASKSLAFVSEQLRYSAGVAHKIFAKCVPRDNGTHNKQCQNCSTPQYDLLQC